MFFQTIYKWFKALFGQELFDYFRGYDSIKEEIIGSNQFISIGIITVVITFLFMLLYYYVINHPRFNQWWSWLIVLVFVGLVNLFVGYGLTPSLSGGNIPASLMTQLEDGNSIPLIGQIECWGFGLANSIVSIMWFIVFSLCFKWWSRNCKYSPFIKF